MPLSAQQLRELKTKVAKQAPVVANSLVLDFVPEPPSDLTEEAVSYWIYYCDTLLQGKCLRRTYMTSIHNLCIAHMLRDALMEELAEQGVVLEFNRVNKEGFVETSKRVNPIVRTLGVHLIQMDKLLASLGMTAYTDNILNYDSSGGQIGKGALRDGFGPPVCDFTPESRVLTVPLVEDTI